MELDLLPKLWTFFEDLDSCKQGERRAFSETTFMRAQACLYTLFNDGAVNNYNILVKSFSACIMNQQHLWTLRKLKNCLTEENTRTTIWGEHICHWSRSNETQSYRWASRWSLDFDCSCPPTPPMINVSFHHLNIFWDKLTLLSEKIISLMNVSVHVFI